MTGWDRDRRGGWLPLPYYGAEVRLHRRRPAGHNAGMCIGVGTLILILVLIWLFA